jgi:hypothetical protein
MGRRFAEATKALERRMLCAVGFEAYLRFFPAGALLDFAPGFDLDDADFEDLTAGFFEDAATFGCFFLAV